MVYENQLVILHKKNKKKTWVIWQIIISEGPKK